MDTLGQQIRDFLFENDELLKPEYTSREDRHPLEGHCYVASEAYYHGSEFTDELTPEVVTVDGDTHWYLRRSSGEIIDLTSEQFDSVPYDDGTPKGFLTKQPSKRAQIVLRAIK